MLKKFEELLFKVKGKYIRDDYLQLMFGYKNCMFIFGPDELMYYKDKDSIGKELKSNSVNKYIEDERRFDMPYGDIPEHVEKKIFVGKFTYANQLLMFETPYLVIKDNIFSKYVAYKNDDEAIVHVKLLNGLMNKGKTKYVNREELENYLKYGEIEKTENEIYKKVYLINCDGKTFSGNFREKEEEWVENRKRVLIEYISSETNYSDRAKNEIINGIKLLTSIEPFEIFDDLYMVKIDKDGNILLEKLLAKYLERDKYELTIKEIKLESENIMTILSDHYSEKIPYTREPVIKKSLNPNAYSENGKIRKRV